MSPPRRPRAARAAPAPHPARCRCVCCVLGDALLLIETGRPRMARTLLAGVPGLVRGVAAEAYEEGREAGLRAARAAEGGDPGPPARRRRG